MRFGTFKVNLQTTRMCTKILNIIMYYCNEEFGRNKTTGFHNFNKQKVLEKYFIKNTFLIVNSR